MYVKCFCILAILIAPINSQAVEMKVACEWKTLNLECRKGEMLSIISANYGRTSTAVCKYQANTNCRSAKSLEIVRQKCNRKQSCSVEAVNTVFGDPCPRTIKYLEVQYKCVAAPPCRNDQFRCDDGKCISNSTRCDGTRDCAAGEDEHGCDYKTSYGCEGSVLNIKCGRGELIRVVGGDYGRSTPNICRWNTNTNCRSPVAKHVLRDLCDLRPDCRIPANNAQFGDPCRGTEKYVEIHYRCWRIPFISYRDLFRYYAKSSGL